MKSIYDFATPKKKAPTKKEGANKPISIEERMRQVKKELDAMWFDSDNVDKVKEDTLVREYDSLKEQHESGEVYYVNF